MAETTEAATALPVASTSTLPQTSNGNTASASRRTHVQQGDWVMLQLPSKNIKVFKLSENTSIINLGKYGTFDAKSQLIGRHYGATLEVVPPASTSASPAPPSTSVASEEHGEHSTANIPKPEGVAEAEASKSNGKKKGRKDRDRDAPQTLCSLRPYEEMTLEEIEVTEATNQNILATGAKTLSYEEILQLKEQGLDGREIIARQIAEHEAFALKNEYSKAKYQKRKESKYLKYFTILPPTMYNICKYHFDSADDKDKRKIRELRPDTLAQIVTLANIRPGSRVVVVDDASGIVTGAIAERMAGQGLIYQMHQNDSPPANPILPLYNLPSSYTSPDILKNMHFGWTEDSWEIDESPAEDNIDEAERVELTDKQKYRAHKRKLAREAQAALVAEYKAGQFDALVICSQFEPMSLLKRFLPVLAGSAQIVVHNPVIQPLSDMLQSLIALDTVLNPTITEPFLRQYQVLPGRTHPEMNGTAHGGFLLHATRVIVDSAEVQQGNIAIGKGRDRRSNKRRRN